MEHVPFVVLSCPKWLLQLLALGVSEPQLVQPQRLFIIQGTSPVLSPVQLSVPAPFPRAALTPAAL